MKLITDSEQFDCLMQAAEAIIFKHSTNCGISSRVHREVERFLSECPHQFFHKVHVIEYRPVSQYIAQRTGIRHASPQVIVLRQGSVVWHASHFDITAEALIKHSSQCSG